MKLAIDTIELAKPIQVRQSMDTDTIQAYAAAMQRGDVFPPLVAFAEEGSKRIILADGAHRLHACVEAGIDSVEVDVREGGLHEALIYALGANDSHGLRRTRADRRNAVEIALRDPAISQMSLREIAEICRVTHTTVARIRSELRCKQNSPKQRVTKLQQPKPPSITDIRPSRPEPTQAEVDRAELRQALSLIKAFPYGGGGCTGLDLTRDDIKDLGYAKDWLAEAEAAVAELFEDVG